ncbi:MAG: hypothetical protein LUH47_10305 [Clostridiales bacterium]|nr:hypothetical protein [Clostridiales bacterium]
MTKKEYKKIAKVIAATYGCEELVEDKFIFNTWYKFLKDYSASHLKEMKAVDGAIEDMLEAERADADNSIDVLESEMRTIHSTPAN